MNEDQVWGIKHVEIDSLSNEESMRFQSWLRKVTLYDYQTAKFLLAPYKHGIILSGLKGRIDTKIDWELF